MKLISDDEDYGTGFSITYKALTPDILPGKFKPSNVPAYTLGWGPGKKCQEKMNQRKLLWYFCVDDVFMGGP